MGLTMKSDTLAALSGTFPEHIPSKETLNHPDLIRHVSGLDPFTDTAAALATTWTKLGIDIHPPLPRANAVAPDVPGAGCVDPDTACICRTMPSVSMAARASDRA